MTAATESGIRTSSRPHGDRRDRIGDTDIDEAADDCGLSRETFELLALLGVGRRRFLLGRS